MIVRSKSPIRLAIAGGGTDISAYIDLYGGAVLNATIDMFAYCTIETIDANNSLKFISLDLDKKAYL
jgi:D-glycero-alpha-D-manno-heptose-7-phosphate kinase